MLTAEFYEEGVGKLLALPTRVRTVEVWIMGERFQLAYMEDPETWNRPGGLEYNVRYLTRSFQTVLTSKFRKEYEKLHGE
ncbi:hypothetical protein GEORGE_35 [Mycobacterium phage George]|uniref:Uncharacterized protein n=1 Tax=Mycobacterium phage George TaxID=2920883 RepID=G1BQ81_9CAUD|nr:hypothetical protein FGG53_gp53 [Mycobacterium phage George]AEK32666.1 hypothetical protein GEORGE_35 [Mycobacterium phage George]